MSELEFSRAIVHHGGDIIWSRPGIIKSTCVFDLQYFPYDMQTCHFKFGSWVYPKEFYKFTDIFCSCRHVKLYGKRRMDCC